MRSGNNCGRQNQIVINIVIGVKLGGSRNESDVALSRTAESKVDGGCGRCVVGRIDDRTVQQCRIRVHRLKQSHRITKLAVDTAD